MGLPCHHLLRACGGACTLQARRQAQHGKWHMPVAPHEPKVSTVQQDAVDGVSEEPVSLVASIATIPAAVTPPPVDKLAQPSRKKAVAWSIPVESDSEDEDQRWWAAGTAGTHVAEASSNMRSAADAQPSVEHLTSELQQQSELQQELEQRHAPEVCDATTAWHRLTQCSVIVGVYPDQATGAAALPLSSWWRIAGCAQVVHMPYWDGPVALPSPTSHPPIGCVQSSLLTWQSLMASPLRWCPAASTAASSPGAGSWRAGWGAGEW